MAELLVNDVETTLAAGIDADDTTLVVASAAGMPATGDWRVWVGDPESGEHELMLVTARTGTSLTVERGIESTTAAPRSSGDTVAAVVTAGSLQALGISVPAVLTGPDVETQEERDELNDGVTAGATLRIKGPLLTEDVIGVPGGLRATAIHADGSYSLLNRHEVSVWTVTEEILDTGDTTDGCGSSMSLQASTNPYGHSGHSVVPPVDENSDYAGTGDELAYSARGRLTQRRTFRVSLNGKTRIEPDDDRPGLTVLPCPEGQTEDLIRWLQSDSTPPVGRWGGVLASGHLYVAVGTPALDADLEDGDTVFWTDADDGLMVKTRLGDGTVVSGVVVLQGTETTYTIRDNGTSPAANTIELATDLEIGSPTPKLVLRDGEVIGQGAIVIADNNGNLEIPLPDELAPDISQRRIPIAHAGTGQGTAVLLNLTDYHVIQIAIAGGLPDNGDVFYLDALRYRVGTPA